MSFTKNRQLFFILCVTISITSRLNFKTTTISDGAKIEYQKNKLGENPLGEDSIGTTPVSLVVCDGVGGSKISSKFISQYLVNSFQKFILKDLTRDPFEIVEELRMERQIKTTLNDFPSQFNALMSNSILEWEKSTAHKFEITPSKMSSSSTFVAAILLSDFMEEKNFLKIIQKGDSLATIFQVTLGPKGNYYQPSYFLKDQQYQFNYPYQFSSDKKNIESEIFYDTIEVKENDVVILGSDGLFDNVHFGFLAMAFNSLIFLNDKDEKDINKIFNNIILIYKDILKRKNWIVNKHYGNIPFDITSKMEENDEYSLKTTTVITSNNEELESRQYIRKTTSETFEKFYKRVTSPFSNDSTIPLKVKNAFLKFFKCPIIEMLSIPLNYGNRDDLLSDCVQKILKDDLTADDKLTEFINAFDSKRSSSIIAKIALTFSLFDKEYPSPFSIHGWKENVNTFNVGFGKKDDISVIATIVKTVENKSVTKQSLIDEFEVSSKEWENTMKLDVASILETNFKREGMTQGQLQAEKSQIGEPKYKDEDINDILFEYQKPEVQEEGLSEETKQFIEEMKAKENRLKYGINIKKPNASQKTPIETAKIKKTSTTDKSQTFGTISKPKTVEKIRI